MKTFASLVARFVTPSSLATTFVLALATFFTGCADESGETPSKPLIVVTTTHLSDLVRTISGDRAEVTTLMGPGVDPHLYKPTSRDLSSLSKADLIVYHGLLLEGRMGEALQQAENKGIPTLAATSGIPASMLISDAGDDNSHGNVDPHVWFSTQAWTACLNTVTERLVELEPSSAQVFRQNALLMQREIAKVGDWARERINEIPQDKRKLVTSHDAFRYLGRDLGLNVIGLQGISTNVEAGLADRANLVEFIVSQEIPAIFIESSVNPGAMREIARESKVVIGGELFSDALGPPGERVSGPGEESHGLDTWSGTMIHNVSTIVEALSVKPR
ncbi:MAG TPA: ABC transporter substrate-binding protein [Opitutae bacterium]|nr:ABC transporter substrate-binding protein [Opitutae bacterium]